MLKTKLGCFFLLAAHALFMVAGSSNGANEVSLTIKDSGYSLSMSRTTGSVTYLGKNENLLTDGGEPLFRIRFRDEDGTPHIYTAADARTCTLVERGKHLTFAYSDFPDRFFQVQVWRHRLPAKQHKKSVHICSFFAFIFINYLPCLLNGTVVTTGCTHFTHNSLLCFFW